MASPVGTFVEQLDFLFFAKGPACPFGEAGLERLRGVIAAEAVCGKDGWKETD